MASSGVAPLAERPLITTHVLDTTKGHPVGGLPVSLYKLANDQWILLNNSETNANGRCETLRGIGNPSFTAGRYKIRFQVERYFLTTKTPALYPMVEIIFDIGNSQEHYHLPLLLNPFGYSTYRGS